MAEISSNNSKSGGDRRAKVRSKKRSTKIDMTPMVDLAFLLLTFFMLANVLVQPKVMDVAMPKDSEDTQPININNVLSLTLSENDKIYYTLGNAQAPQLTNYAKIRKILIDNSGKNKKLYVLIKPTDQSNYQNIVDILDEMSIAQISRYALVDPSQDDLEKIKNL